MNNERNKVLHGAAMEAVNVLMKYPLASVEERIKCLAVAKASLELMEFDCLLHEGHCSEGNRCVCGGDTPGVRAGCGNWVKTASDAVSEGGKNG